MVQLDHHSTSKQNFRITFKRLLKGFPVAALLVGSVALSMPARAAPSDGELAPKAVIEGAPLSIEEARAGLSGVWIVTNFVNSTKPIDLRITKTIEGEDPPMQPWVREIYEKRISDARAGRIFADTESYCVASGMPRAMRGPNYPIQILQTPGQVTILFEALHNMRFIYLDEPLPSKDEVEPSLWGVSAGHWEGDTLVVKTIGLSERTTLDKLGLPHSDELEVTERIRLTSKDTFEDLITITDPKAFTRPWQIKATYKRMPPGTRLMEYECADNNRYKVNADGTLAQPQP